MSVRSRSRSPVHRGSEPYEIESASDNEDDAPPKPDCRKFCLDNYPARWSYKTIKEFIVERTGSSDIVNAIRYINFNKDRSKYPVTTSTVEFTTPEACRQTYKQLQAKRNQKVDGNFVLIRWERNDHSNNSSSQSSGNKKNQQNANTLNKRNKKSTGGPSNTPINLNTYGLSSAFLNQLGITVPILNKIFVANLDKQVDEDKVREVFGLAGQVVNVFIIHKENKPKMAKIEFDHPLEAVQAISMFHNQELFGRILAVQIDNSPNLHSKSLPNGLGSIGPGLGPNGEPLRGLGFIAELQPLKEFVATEIPKLKSLLGAHDQSHVNLNSMTQQDNNMGLLNTMSSMNVMTPLNVNTVNPFGQVTPPVVNTFAQGNQGLQMLQGLLQQNAGNDLTATLAALQSQTMTPSLTGLAQNIGAGQNSWNPQSQLNVMNQMQQNTMSDSVSNNNSNSYDKRQRSDDNDRKMMTTDMLIFNNLPSSVTLSALKTKMQEVGDIKFAEITDEGKAIVRFHNAQDAERCVKLFDRSKVDGQTIHVRFF